MKDILLNLTTIGFYGLPLDYLDTYRNKIEAVNLEQIKEAFNRRINLGDMITVTVGAKNQ